VQKYLSLLLQITLFALGCLLYASKISLAQVTSDGTVNTQVNQNGNVSEITGGERAGDNLFHSFQDFSVGTGNEASFLNANDIANIFSRVTGGNVSNIDGLISANGSANLFLINPAGIIFGENAKLDVGGSFLSSTADSILFEDGQFSATDLENPPVLTINAPIGLNLRDQPADIVNRSVVKDTTGEVVGLEVAPGNNLTFVGGNIDFEDGEATASGGNIELGGLSATGTVGINPDSSLSFPESVARADVNFNISEVDVQGTGGGNITINTRNLNLKAGEFDSSFLRAGITADSTSPEAQAGDITINATESVALDISDILNNVEEGGVGNSGKINLTTPNLSITNASSINADTFGQGNAGLIDINATESITLDLSYISSKGLLDSQGNGGELNITTPNLSLTYGSSIDAGIAEQGNAGLIDINATESIALDGSDISITTGVDSQSNAGGEINITTPNLSLANGSSIDAETFGQGNAGLIDINSTESIALDGSRISITTGLDSQGNGGEINITTPNLSLTNFGSIDADIAGKGNGGSININANESITLDRSYISSKAISNAEGNSGEINITTPNLSLTNFGSIDADIAGQGDGGSVNINATESITLNERSSISSKTGVDNKGNAGNLNITTSNLSLTNSSAIIADTFGKGDAGSVNINATESITLNNDGFISSTVNAKNAEGNGGELNITTPNLSLTDSAIDANTLGQGNAGLIDINATKSITLDDSFISSTASIDSEGNGGELNITTPNLSLTNNSNIFAASLGQGDGGKLNITTFNLSLAKESLITTATLGQGDAGLININANILSLDNGSISAQALNNANGGNLEIDANVIVAYPNGNSDILASAEKGEGGNITINADSVLGIEERSLNNSTNDINASSQVRGLDGSVRVNTLDVNPVQGVRELPSNVVEVEQTTDQTCQANREAAARNGLVINGKGGIPATPDLPLTSQNILINGEVASDPTIPPPIKTSKGKIQLARGIKITKDGQVILTAYRTNNAGERIFEGQINCGQM
jgi:filamentous hemagglutinin family protein